MKLATKLVTVFVLILLVVIVVNAFFATRDARAWHGTRAREDITRVGTTVHHAMMSIDASGRHVRLMEIIERINAASSSLQVRWVRFDAAGMPHEQPVLPVGMTDLDEPGALFWPTGTDQVLLAYLHIPIDDVRSSGGVEIRAGRDDLVAHRTTLLVRSLQMTGLLILLSSVTAVFFGTRWVSRPLDELVRKVQRIGDTDLGGPVEIGGNDELGQLGRALNTMCDDLAESHEHIRRETAARIEAIDLLRHADRLRTVGGLAAGIAHEIGTPLTVVSGRAEMIASGRLAEPEVIENARTIKTQSDRIARIIRQVLDFARVSPPDRSEVDLREVVAAIVGLLAPIARGRHVEIATESPTAPIIASVDPAQVQQVVSNLVMNAIQAMPGGGRVTVSLDTVRARAPEDEEGADRPCVRLRVRDEGPGIPPEDRDRLFDPFFTTKEVGEGTGMGLAVAHGIIREHDGWIAVESEAGRGSVFSILVPEEGMA